MPTPDGKKPRQEKPGRLPGYEPSEETNKLRDKNAKRSKKLNNVQRRERENLMYELRLGGYTLQQIAVKLDVTVSCVSQAISKRLKKRHQPLLEELRAVELDRLDKYLKALEERIERGDTLAIQTALRVADRRSKLLGLDMDHLKVNPNTGELSEIDLELQDLLSSAKARTTMRAKELGADISFQSVKKQTEHFHTAAIQDDIDNDK